MGWLELDECVHDISIDGCCRLCGLRIIPEDKPPPRSGPKRGDVNDDLKEFTGLRPSELAHVQTIAWLENKIKDLEKQLEGSHRNCGCA